MWINLVTQGHRNGRTRVFTQIFGIGKLKSMGYYAALFAKSCVCLISVHFVSFWYNADLWRTKRTARRTDRRTQAHSIYRAIKKGRSGNAQGRAIMRLEINTLVVCWTVNTDISPKIEKYNMKSNDALSKNLTKIRVSPPVVPFLSFYVRCMFLSFTFSHFVRLWLGFLNYPLPYGKQMSHVGRDVWRK